MATRPAHGSVSRTTLIWLVVASMLIISGIGVYIAIHTSAPGTTRQGATVNLDPSNPDAAAVLPPVPTSEGQLSGENGRAQFADKDDPSRLAGEMLYRRFDPQPRGRYALEEPQLWLFMKDGRTLHVQAATGNVKFFAGTKNKPESGRLEGGVVARLYGAGVATPETRPDPEVTPPEMLGYADSIIFDLAVGEFTTPDVINLSTRDMELQGEGLEVVIDEVRESVSSIKLGAIGYLHARAGSERPEAKAKSPAPTGATTPAAATPTSPTEPPPPPKIDLYTITIAGPVALSVGTREPQSITSDTLLAWARLIDGKLPAGAIAELNEGRPARAAEPGTPPVTPAPPADGAAAPPAPAQAPAVTSMADRLARLRVPGPSGLRPLTPISDDDALLTWGGQLTALAVTDAPAELKGEDVAVRFVSQGESPVMLSDARSGATVLCDSAHYGATSAGVRLRAREGEDTRITIADARQGFGELPGLDLNLKSGVGQTRGPGYFSRRDPDKPGAKASGEGEVRQRLAWEDQADFEFAPGDGAGSGAIRFAVFSGGVNAASGEAQVTGDVMRAWFEPAKASDALLQKVVVEGNALGKTLGEQEPQRLEGTKFELTFTQDEKGASSYPEKLIVTGGVKGARTELLKEGDAATRTPVTSDLVCDELHADLMRDEKGNILVTEATARGSASFTRSDGVLAVGDEIHAIVRDEEVHITGPAANVAARGGTLRAPDLHLDAQSNAVIARGPGELTHVNPDASEAPSDDRPPALPATMVGRTTLNWTKGMRYDDAKGEGEAVGSVVAETYPDAFTQNIVKGGQVRILTAPADAAPSKNGPTGENVLGDVKLLRAEAFGDEPGESTGKRALAEQRTYVQDLGAPEGRRLEKLVYVEGASLSADEQNGEFSVPSAGRALVLDHSATERGGTPGEGGVFAGSSSRGTTLMEWSGSMIMQRAIERANVDGGVRVTHKPLSDTSRPVVLESDSVEAQFRLARPGETGARDQLERVTARGTVRVETDKGDRELRADEASYDAVSETVEASATTEYGSVTFLDKTKAVPTIAKRMRWNLRTDEITILEPMPVIIPAK